MDRRSEDDHRRGDRYRREEGRREKRSSDRGHHRRSNRDRDEGISEPRRERSERSRSPRKRSQQLPFQAKQLTSRDLPSREKLFAIYLRMQKELDIRRLDEREVRGRWKSFVKKWNAGDLARSWYDPAIVDEINPFDDDDYGEDEYYEEDEPARLPEPTREPAPVGRASEGEARLEEHGSESDSDESVGPAIPTGAPARSRLGPANPTVSDLRDRDEILREEAAAVHREAREARYAENKRERAVEKDRLDEIVPRADAGTRERKLENKRLKTEAHRELASTKQGGDEDLGEEESIGYGNEDSYARLKALEKQNEKKKTDRQIRREEIFRARAAEREVRLSAIREQEEKTIAMLKALAKSQFG